MSNEDFHSILNIMHELDLIQKFEDNAGKKGKPGVLWRATALIKKVKEHNKILDVYANLR